jgi:hypothetical protein
MGTEGVGVPAERRRASSVVSGISCRASDCLENIHLNVQELLRLTAPSYMASTDVEDLKKQLGECGESGERSCDGMDGVLLEEKLVRIEAEADELEYSTHEKKLTLEAQRANECYGLATQPLNIEIPDAHTGMVAVKMRKGGDVKRPYGPAAAKPVRQPKAAKPARVGKADAQAGEQSKAKAKRRAGNRAADKPQAGLDEPVPVPVVEQAIRPAGDRSPGRKRKNTLLGRANASAAISSVALDQELEVKERPSQPQPDKVPERKRKNTLLGRANASAAISSVALDQELELGDEPPEKSPDKAPERRRKNTLLGRANASAAISSVALDQELEVEEGSHRERRSTECSRHHRDGDDPAQKQKHDAELAHEREQRESGLQDHGSSQPQPDKVPERKRKNTLLGRSDASAAIASVALDQELEGGEGDAVAALPAPPPDARPSKPAGRQRKNTLLDTPVAQAALAAAGPVLLDEDVDEDAAAESGDSGSGSDCDR